MVNRLLHSFKSKKPIWMISVIENVPFNEGFISMRQVFKYRDVGNMNLNELEYESTAVNKMPRLHYLELWYTILNRPTFPRYNMIHLFNTMTKVLQASFISSWNILTLTMWYRFGHVVCPDDHFCVVLYPSQSYPWQCNIHHILYQTNEVLGERLQVSPRLSPFQYNSLYLQAKGKTTIVVISWHKICHF